MHQSFIFIFIFYCFWFANSIGYNLELKLEFDSLVGQLTSKPPPNPLLPQHKF